MLAGERAAVAEHQIGGALDEFAIVADAGFALQVEIDAHVDAAVAEVAVERSLIVIFVEQLANIAEIRAHFFRGDGGIVPAFPFGRRARCGGGGAHAGFADSPQNGGFRGGVDAHGGGIRAFLQARHELLRETLGVFRIVGAEFDQENAAALGNEIETGLIFLAQVVDHGGFKAFEADGAELKNFGDMVGGLEGVRVTEAEQRAVLRTVDQVELGFENRYAGALGADERARDVESVFRQQLIEVVAGDAARNVGEFRADLRGVLVADVAQGGVDFGAAAALVNDGGEFGVRGCSYGHLRAVVEQDAQLGDVVDGFAGEERMGAAGIVSDHAAESAAIVGGRVGAEG